MMLYDNWYSLTMSYCKSQVIDYQIYTASQSWRSIVLEEIPGDILAGDTIDTVLLTYLPVERVLDGTTVERATNITISQSIEEIHRVAKLIEQCVTDVIHTDEFIVHLGSQVTYNYITNNCTCAHVAKVELTCTDEYKTLWQLSKADIFELIKQQELNCEF